MNDDVYVFVNKRVLWAEGNDGAGRWLEPGSAHPLSVQEAEGLQRLMPGTVDRVERVDEHHERSRALAAAEAERAAADLAAKEEGQQ